ncbi:hypothetical protein SLH46_15615 [Draconibacterium sp. IB214405]|uniref:hypothetical protein n=1 Tax=Draconibacterium sp. IB214405 TaxID=3097352 RepID=UPI002A0D8915|nr:hypothetical protein [Draconibacterium sp. IB214405]MDX8340625.1 hypothetical protein [Draconibacterium sp. IB214405]
MGFGGSVLAMIQSLRANARPKHHAYQDWEKADKRIFKNKYKLVSKQVSPEKLAQLKTKYRKEIEKDQKRTLILTILSIVIIIPLITFGIFQFFFSNSQNNYRPYVSEAEKQKTEITIEQINYLLDSGYDWLNKSHYKNARYQFNRVLEVIPTNKDALFGMTASYVYECQKEHTNCERATELLQNYISKFGSDTKTDHLSTILKSGD